jgi:hypothetical protein
MIMILNTKKLSLLAEEKIANIDITKATVPVTINDNNIGGSTTGTPVTKKYVMSDAFNQSVLYTTQAKTSEQQSIARENIGAVSAADLQTEISNRSTADTTINNRISTLATNLSTETENRTAADTALSDRINTEITNREAADGALNASLTTEVNARQSADNTLTAAVAGKQDKLTAGTNITITNNVISASGGQTLASASSLVDPNAYSANSIGYAASTTMFTRTADMAWSTGNGTYNHPTNASSTSGLFQMYLIYGSDSSVQKYTVINSFKLSRCGFCGLLEGTVVFNPQSASGWYFGTGAGPYTSTGISPKNQSTLAVQLASSHGLMTGGGFVLFTGESTVFCNIYNNGTNSFMNFAATTTFGNFTAGTAYEFHIPVSFTTAV